MIKHSFLIALALIAGQFVVGQQHLISAMSTVTFKIKNLGFHGGWQFFRLERGCQVQQVKAR